MHRSVDLWRRSGCAWLTGRPDGEPNDGGHRAAAYAHNVATEIADSSETLGCHVELDGPSILAERSVHTRFQRGANVSCNRTTRLLACLDDHVSVTIARDDDRDLLAASFEAKLAATDDVWEFAKIQCAHRNAEEVRDRATLFGLSVAILGEASESHPARAIEYPGVGRRREQPVVVDLSSLWAGPLAANILGLAGARVVKVESKDRLDGARFGSRSFYDLLHGGHESVALCFTTQRAELRTLIANADVVITSARPRAFEQLGIVAEELMAENEITAWLAITAFGPRDRNRIGFGDDTAIAAGLCAFDQDGPMFAADAIADPLTGLVAASHALQALVSGQRALYDLNLVDVASTAAASVTGCDTDTSDTTDTTSADARRRHHTAAALPHSRPVVSGAPTPGAHNERWLP